MVGACRARAGNPKWEDGSNPVRLWLKRVSVKSRCFVQNVQLVDPLEIVKHETRPESHRFPLPEIMINALCVLREGLITAVQLAVMPQIMDPNLESVAPELFQKFSRDLIRAFGD